MKRLQALLLFGLLSAGANAAVAATDSLNDFTPKVLPVLVHVNAHGKVTEVSPSRELSPRIDRLLRQSLDQMVAGPASDHGHARSSQFIMNLAMQATPRDDGKYDARFAYVSMSPVPSGSWYWVHVDGHRLALADQQHRPMHDHRPQFRSDHIPHYRTPSHEYGPATHVSSRTASSSRTSGHGR